MRKRIIIGVMIALIIGVSGTNYFGQSLVSKSGYTYSGTTSRDKNILALNQAMRKLWTDHMQYTYATVNAFYHNPTAVEANLDRLLQNQKEMGAAIVPYYGKDAGDSLAALLTTHIQQAVPVLKAAKAGDKVALDKALTDWYANADEIAVFLSKANPKNWKESATKPMMKAHISQTTAYSVDILKGDYAQAVKDYDEAYHHMMMLADTLTDGIVKQFPKKFK
ncbi:MAG: hypothetical protein ACRD6X_19140 [Pyrinomonadaceae bacterium]